MNLTLETDRLILQVLFEDQAILTTRFYQRNWQFLSQWEPNMSIQAADIQVQKNGLRYEFEQLKQGHFIRYWYASKDQPELLFGSVCFQNISRFPFQSCQIGYKQDPSCMGQGFATEAASAAISHLFRDGSIHRIEALAETGNAASLRLLQRLGFDLEGVARQAVYLRDGWQDCCRYALINHLWKK